MPDSRLTETTVEAPGGPLRVLEGGAGTALLVIHGMASDAEAWRDGAEILAGAGLRPIAYDRRGYGGSPAPEPYGATTIAEQARDAVAVLGRLDAAPAIVAGDGFGALVALDLVLRHRELVRGVALANPPLLQFLPEAAEWLTQTQIQLRSALRSGGPAAAVDLWLGGRVDGEPLARAQASATAFLADYAGMTSLELTVGELRAIDVPVAVTAAAQAPPHIAAGADRLLELVPGARRLDGGELIAAARAIV